MKFVEFILICYDFCVNHDILQRLKLYRLFSIFGNIFFPLYFRLSFSKYKLRMRTSSDKLNIITLTTFPKRIGKIWIVIELMFRQTCRPDRIILYLAKDEINSFSNLPNRLKKQVQKGLEIEFVNDNFYSHNKYFHALKKYPNDNIITIDDDIFYSTTLISKLVKTSKIYPDSICCNYALTIQKSDVIHPYVEWKKSKYEKSSRNFLMGVGGVLYPPGCLPPSLFRADVFMNICPFADDIWLNCMADMNKTAIVMTKNSYAYMPVYFRENKKLTNINVSQGKNDEQLAAVRLFLKDEYGIDSMEQI